jgi:hypothetical protein
MKLLAFAPVLLFAGCSREGGHDDLHRPAMPKRTPEPTATPKLPKEPREPQELGQPEEPREPQEIFIEFGNILDKSTLSQEQSGTIWDGYRHVQFSIQVKGRVLIGYYGRGDWKIEFRDDVMGLWGLDGLTAGAELFVIDYKTGLKSGPIDVKPILSMYSKVCEYLQDGAIQRARNLMARDVEIVDDPNMPEYGPLNVRSFKSRGDFAIRGMAIVGDGVAVSNGWAEFHFHKVDGQWLITKGWIRPEI